VPKHYLKGIDRHKNALFTKLEGDRAANLDKKLGIDYPAYHAMNMHAQRSTIKALDAQRRFENQQYQVKPESQSATIQKVPKNKVIRDTANSTQFSNKSPGLANFGGISTQATSQPSFRRAKATSANEFTIN